MGHIPCEGSQRGQASISSADGVATVALEMVEISDEWESDSRRYLNMEIGCHVLRFTEGMLHYRKTGSFIFALKLHN